MKQSCYDILYLYGLGLSVSFLGGFVIIVHDEAHIKCTIRSIVI